MPLRLLSTPITATRSAIGVVPGADSVTVCGISTVSGSGSIWLSGCCSGAPCGVQAESMSSPAAAARTRFAMSYSGVQAS